MYSQQLRMSHRSDCVDIQQRFLFGDEHVQLVYLGDHVHIDVTWIHTKDW